MLCGTFCDTPPREPCTSSSLTPFHSQSHTQSLHRTLQPSGFLQRHLTLTHEEHLRSADVKTFTDLNTFHSQRNSDSPSAEQSHLWCCWAGMHRPRAAWRRRPHCPVGCDTGGREQASDTQAGGGVGWGGQWRAAAVSILTSKPLRLKVLTPTGAASHLSLLLMETLSSTLLTEPLHWSSAGEGGGHISPAGAHTDVCVRFQAEFGFVGTVCNCMGRWGRTRLFARHQLDVSVRH